MIREVMEKMAPLWTNLAFPSRFIRQFAMVETWKTMTRNLDTHLFEELLEGQADRYLKGEIIFK